MKEIGGYFQLEEMPGEGGIASSRYPIRLMFYKGE